MTSTPTSALENAVVVDTDVLSFWEKDDSRGPQYRAAVSDRILVISFQTLAEQFQWSLERGWGGRRRVQSEDSLKRFIVYESSRELATGWADIMATARRLGRPIGPSDAWIAATARLIGVPLATHNRRDFERVPRLELITFAPTAQA